MVQAVEEGCLLINHPTNVVSQLSESMRSTGSNNSQFGYAKMGIP